MLYGGVQFGVYGNLREWILSIVGKEKQMIGSAVAGAGAGLCATVVSYPFDLMRTRLAIQKIAKSIGRGDMVSPQFLKNMVSVDFV